MVRLGRTTGPHSQRRQIGAACDWWGGRWKEDFDRAAETGQNAHRLSIEWSRIQPAPDRWDEDALDHYRTMMRGTVERGMMPMVTLHHFSDPIWLYEQGGWENDDTPAAFERFVRKVVEALKEYVTYWVTINEPNVYADGAYLGGGFPPGKNDESRHFTCCATWCAGTAWPITPSIKFSPRRAWGLPTITVRCARPSGFPPDVWMARLMSSNFNRRFRHAAQTGQIRFLTTARKCQKPPARRILSASIITRATWCSSS